MPDDLLLTSELQDALARAILSLPETYRPVVLLRDIEEFARTVKCSPAARSSPRARSGILEHNISI